MVILKERVGSSSFFDDDSTILTAGLRSILCNWTVHRIIVCVALQIFSETTTDIGNDSRLRLFAVPPDVGACSHVKHMCFP